MSGNNAFFIKEKKGDYDLVIPLDNDNDDNDSEGHDPVEYDDDDQNNDDFDNNTATPGNTSWKKTMMKSLIPDETILKMLNSYNSNRLLDGVEGVRFLKFIIFTFLSIVCTFWFVRWMGFLEHDGSYTLSDMILYESDAILLDCALFFIIGRVYKTNGIDSIGWMSVTVLASLYSSFSPLFPFLQHSVSLYEMHCVWPLSLWIYLVALIVFCSLIVFYHIKCMIQHRLILQKLFEMSLCFVIFLLPKLPNPYFHFHHWYAGWFLGMHCNFHSKVWSTLIMAWCWGLYINGIAVWGRDPTLTCDYALYLSASLGCPYLQCYMEAMENPENHTDITIMEPADWWNCSADGGYVA